MMRGMGLCMIVPVIASKLVMGCMPGEVGIFSS